MTDSELEAKGFFQVGGNLGPDARSYVVRRADEELPGLILADHFCYVLTSRQMGKSSLMVRTAEKLQAKGIRTAEVDLTFIGTQMPAEAWYLSFISQIHGQLGLSIDFEAWWDTRSKLSAVQRFSDFLRQVVLEEISGKVVIFIDEIETTLSLDFSDDFFAAIRAVYNARASDPAYGRLTFVLLGVAMPGDLIEDRTRTPFNIGQGVTLQEFSQEEGAVLQKGLESACPGEGEAIFTRIYHWTEGHPYLTQKLCAAAVAAGDGPWDEGRVDALVEESFFGEEALRKDSNLQMIRDRTRTDPSSRQLLRLYRQVWEGKEVRDEERSVAKSRLKLYGLVKATRGGMLTVRNRVYEQVFDLDWVKEVMPRDRARWLTAVSVLVAVVAMAITGYLLIRQRQQTAEFYIEQFLASSSADVRVTSLAGLIGLTGYEDEVHSLFFEELGHEERIAMFEVSSPAGLEDELLSVVKGLYTQLDNTSRDNSVLEAMKDTLEELDDPAARNLFLETKQWLVGRRSCSQGAYREAVEAYNVAVGLNGGNARIYFDRALAYLAMADFEVALSDIVTAVELDETLETKARQIIDEDPELLTYLAQHRGEYPILAAWVPELTSTPTYGPSPAASSTPSPTVSPTPPVSGPTPILSPTPEIRSNVISIENASQVTQLARWGNETVKGVDYSREGRLVVASSMGLVLYDIQTLVTLSVVQTDVPVTTVVFSPNGRMLAAGMEDNTITLWRVVDMQPNPELGNAEHGEKSANLVSAGVLRGHEGRIRSLDFAARGQLIASGSADGTVRIWNAEDKEQLSVLDDHDGGVTDVAFSADETKLISGSEGGTIRIWQVGGARQLHVLDSDGQEVNSVAFSPDGTLVAAGVCVEKQYLDCVKGEIRLWRVNSGELAATLEGHGGSVSDIVFSPDQTMLASGSGDHTTRLWQATGAPTQRGLRRIGSPILPGIQGPVSTGVSLQTLAVLKGHTSGVNSLVFSPDGMRLVSGSSDNTIRVWEVLTGHIVAGLSRMIPAVKSLAFSPDGETLASGSSAGVIKLWRVSDGALIPTQARHAGEDANSVAFSPDGTMLASGSSDNTVRLWRIAECERGIEECGVPVRVLRGHWDWVKSVAFSPDGSLLASASLDSTVRLSDVDSGDLIRTLGRRISGVHAIAFSPSRAVLAAGSLDGTVRLWGVDDGELLYTLEGPHKKVTSVAFSPDGTHLASGSADGMVRLWRVLDGRPMQFLKGHAGAVYAVAFSPDSSLLVSGALDGALMLWRVDDSIPLPLCKLQGHEAGVLSVAFSPDGTLIASGSGDRTVRLWGIDHSDD